MTTLYDELKTLTDNPHVIAAINTAAIPGAPSGLLSALEKHVSILPKVPAGKRFLKDCFWAKFQSRFIWHTAFGDDQTRKESTARWLRSMREASQRRGYTWPPEPIFVPAVTVPEVWTGKEEKPGRVPRDGKS